MADTGKIIPEETQEDVENVEETTEEPVEESTEDAIDYEAELEAERKRREKAESQVQYLRSKSKEEPPETNEEEGDLESRLLNNLTTILDERDAKLEKKANEERVKQLAERLSGDPNEAKLVEEIYRNRLVPSGDTEADVQIAHLIANRKRYIQEGEEVKRALASKEAIKPSSGEPGAPRSGQTVAPDLAGYPHLQLMMTEANMKWTSNKRRWQNDQRWMAIDKDGNVTSGKV